MEAAKRTLSMSEEQLNEVLSWIRDDRLKLAVLESQFKQSQEAQKEMLAEVKSLRQQIKSDVTEIVANCRALQSTKEKKDSGDESKHPVAADASAIVTTFKYLGAVLAGFVAAVGAWFTHGGGK
jgi:cysteinyl-tRNA synthetase